MGFWIFVMIVNLLTPLIMIVFGKIFMNNAPKDINWGFGYRSSMSMKNKETWKFAHHFCGKLWFYMGCIMAVLSVLSMLFVIGQEKDVIGDVAGVICGVQVFILLFSIIPTEVALRRNFDKNGIRK